MLWAAPLPKFIETLIKEHGLVAAVSLQPTVIFCCLRKEFDSIRAKACQTKTSYLLVGNLSCYNFVSRNDCMIPCKATLHNIHKASQCLALALSWSNLRLVWTGKQHAWPTVYAVDCTTPNIHWNVDQRTRVGCNRELAVYSNFLLLAQKSRFNKCRSTQTETSYLPMGNHFCYSFVSRNNCMIPCEATLHNVHKASQCLALALSWSNLRLVWTGKQHAWPTVYAVGCTTPNFHWNVDRRTRVGCNRAACSDFLLLLMLKIRFNTCESILAWN